MDSSSLGVSREVVALMKLPLQHSGHYGMAKEEES